MSTQPNPKPPTPAPAPAPAPAPPPPPPPQLSSDVKTWVVVVLTLVFVTMYCLALWGVIPPLTDDKLVSRLEPIIFVIVGYYFGRLPGQSNERSLQGELQRQASKTDAAEQKQKGSDQQATEARANLAQAQQRLKDVRAVLSSAPLPTAAGGTLEAMSFDVGAGGEPRKPGEVPAAAAGPAQTIVAALRMLD